MRNRIDLFLGALLFGWPVLSSASDGDPQSGHVVMRVEEYLVDDVVFHDRSDDVRDFTGNGAVWRDSVRRRTKEGAAHLLQSGAVAGVSEVRCRMESTLEWPQSAERHSRADRSEVPTDYATLTRILGHSLDSRSEVGRGARTIGLSVVSDLAYWVVDRGPRHPDGDQFLLGIFRVTTSSAPVVRSGEWTELAVRRSPNRDGHIVTFVRAQAHQPGNAGTEARARERLAERFGEDPFVPPPPGSPVPDWVVEEYRIAVVGEWFEVEAATAGELLDAHGSGEHVDATDLRTAILGLVRRDEARLADVARVVSHPGVRAATESGSEILLPERIPAPGVPRGLADPIGPSVDAKANAWEGWLGVRKAGSRLETVASAGPDFTHIRLTLAARLTTTLGTVQVGRGNAGHLHPHLHAVDTKAVLDVHDAVPVFVAMSHAAPREAAAAAFDPTRCILVFITASLLVP